MKGTVKAAELAAAIKTAQIVIVSAMKIDALRHVRLTASSGRLEVEATNLDQHIAVSIEANLSEGIAVVDPARLLTALQPVKGEATISCAESFMTVSGKGSRSRLALLPKDTWMGVEKPVAENSFDVDGEGLAQAFETILPATTEDASRPYLGGAHLRWVSGKLIAEACDSHFLLTREVSAREPSTWPSDSVIVPKEFMMAAAKVIKGDAQLSITSSRVILTTSSGWLASKLISATYPNIDRIWDKNAQPALRADRKSLLDIAKLAQQFSEENSDGHRSLAIQETDIVAAGNNGEIFRAAFEGEVIKEQTFFFQPRLLIIALTALTSESVEITDGGKIPHVNSIHGDGARDCVLSQMQPPGWWGRMQKAEAA